MSQWQGYIDGLKQLDAGLRRAGIHDGVWDPRARPFRQTGGKLLTDIPYPERLRVVRMSWRDALNETERAEVGPEALGETKPIVLKNVRLTTPSWLRGPDECAFNPARYWKELYQQTPRIAGMLPEHGAPFTKEQLDYAGKAAIKHFMNANPFDMISTRRRLAPFFSYYGTSGPLTGKKADGIIIDDPIIDQLRSKKVKTPKQPKKDYNTVGVRFLRGHNLAKVYTYRVKKAAKLRLGEEVVVPSQMDGFETNGIAVVVELHKSPQDNGLYDYKHVAGRIQVL
jgi:hypothetical protein